MPEGTDLFWGLSPAAWAAVAALGSFFAAGVAAVLTAVTLKVESARPWLRVSFATLTPGQLRSMVISRRRRRPETWSSNGLDAIMVTIHNGGRTPLRASLPAFEKRLPRWHPTQWWLDIRRWSITVTPSAYPWRGCVTGDSVRVDPFDSATYLLDVSSLFSERPAADGKRYSWRYVRIVVEVAGRRSIRSRPMFLAHPAMHQLSGVAVTVEQLVRRWFLQVALRSGLPEVPSDPNPPKRGLDQWSADFYAETVIQAIRGNEGEITQALIYESLTGVAAAPEDAVEYTFGLGRELVEAGFTTSAVLRSKPLSLPHRSPPPAGRPQRMTFRQVVGMTIGRLIAGLRGAHPR